jgi:hypothetical protein
VQLMSTFHSTEDMEKIHWIHGKKRARIPEDSRVLRELESEACADGMPTEVEMLPVCLPIRDYNLHMGGSDAAAQLLVTYADEVRTLRYWFSLLRFILYASSNNAYALYKAANPDTNMSHYDFQARIALSLMRNPEGNGRKRQPCVTVQGAGDKFPRPAHQIVKQSSRGYCNGGLCHELHGTNTKRKALGEIDGNIPHKKQRSRPSQTYYGCTGCRPDLRICRNKIGCWKAAHE